MIDRKIRAGMEAGDFDNLPGHGRPLHLDDDPLEDPSWRIARRMLKSAGFSHPAIEAKRALEEDIAAGQERIARGALAGEEGEAWRAEIKRRIRDHNLSWPLLALRVESL